MDRATILKKAQNEADEMMIQVKDKSIKFTYIALVLSAAIFSFIRGMRGEPMMDLCATVCISVFAGRIYCYFKTRDKFNLIIAAVTFVVAVFAAARFFMGH